MPKVAKKTKKGGWPKGKKRGKKRGRPAAKKSVKSSGNSIPLLTERTADLNYWSELVTFINTNSGKPFNIRTDGKNVTLHVF